MIVAAAGGVGVLAIFIWFFAFPAKGTPPDLAAKSPSENAKPSEGNEKADRQALPVAPSKKDWREPVAKLVVPDVQFIYHPSSGSTAVPLLSKDRLRVTVLDLASQKWRTVDCSKGTVDKQGAPAVGPIYDVQVSHKGDLLAVVPDFGELGGIRPTGNNVMDVHLWSVDKNTHLGILPIQDTHIQTAFLDAKRLLVLARKSVGIWDVDARTMLESWPPLQVTGGDGRPVAVTRDGRYVAMGTHQVMVRDTLHQGCVRAILDHPEYDEPQTNGLTGFALAFSRDGKELANSWNWTNLGWARLATWDWARGKRLDFVKHTKVQSDSTGHNPTWSVQWLPDRSGWLLGENLVVGRKSTEVGVRLSDARPLHGAVLTHILDDGTLVSLSRRDDDSLDVMYFRAGFPVSPAPEVADASWTESYVMAPSSPSEGHWKLDPNVERSYPYESRLFHCPNGPYAVDWHDRKIDRTFFDFRTGKTVSLQVPGPLSQIASISSDGAWVSMEERAPDTAARHQRDAGGEHRRGKIDKWHYLFNTSTGERLPVFIFQTVDPAPFFHLLPGNRLVTRAPRGLVGVWEVPSYRLLFELPSVGVDDVSAISDSGRYLALAEGDWVIVYDLVEPRICCEAKVNLPQGRVREIAFNRDATRLGVVFEREQAPSKAIAIVDLATRKAASKFHEKHQVSTDRMSPLGKDRWRIGDNVFSDDGTLLGSLASRAIASLDDALLVLVKKEKGEKLDAPKRLGVVPIPEILQPVGPPKSP